MNTPIIDKVVEQLKVLPQELQWRVLEFTRSLAVSTPHGVPGRQLLRFAGAVPIGDLQLMREAIEQGCERVDSASRPLSHLRPFAKRLNRAVRG